MSKIQFGDWWKQGPSGNEVMEVELTELEEPKPTPAQTVARAQMPADLEKACVDEFEYALGLKNGLVFYFHVAHIDSCGEFLTLVQVGGHNVPAPKHGKSGSYPPHAPFNFERGVQVRISEIAWIADAPYGS